MKKTIKIAIIALFMLIAFAAFSVVNAETATISTNKTSVMVGDSVKVTLSVNAAAWNLKVTGSATDTVVGFNANAENEKTTKTYTIDTSKAGTYTVTLTGDITDSTKDKPTKINQTVTITVKEKEVTPTPSTNDTTTTGNITSKPTTEPTPAVKSSNANLSTLGVTPKEYDFTGFKKDKTSYDVTVPSNVDSLKVLYKTEDSKATVKVSGNSGFEIGSNNKIKIAVTAEDGKTTKTYTINVTKLATEEEKPGNLIEEEGIYLTVLEIEGIELSPEFAKDIYSYTATLTDVERTEITVNAKANEENATIQISGNTELALGENTINIVVKSAKTSEQKVYQIVLTKVNQEVEIKKEDTISTSTPTSNGGVMGSLKKYVGIMITVVVIIVASIITLIIILGKENRRLEAEEAETMEETSETKAEEYNVFQDKEAEEESKTEENTELTEESKKKGRHF